MYIYIYIYMYTHIHTYIHTYTHKLLNFVKLYKVHLQLSLNHVNCALTNYRNIKFKRLVFNARLKDFEYYLLLNVEY